jgi:hypothetical protein
MLSERRADQGAARLVAASSLDIDIGQQFVG